MPVPAYLTAFKILPWQAKAGIILVNFLPWFVYWSSYNTSAIDQATVDSARFQGWSMGIILAVFNLALFTVLAISVEQRPQFYKDMVATGEFWKQNE